MRDVHAHHPSGIDTLRVLCTGRDSLVVPAAAMEAWERDYLMSMAFDTGAAMFNMAGYGDTEYARDGLTKTASRPYGVVSRFTFSASFDDQDQSVVSMSGGVGPERDESERMTRPAGQMQSLTLGADEERLRPALAKIARMFVQHWAGHGLMPPAAIEFVNRYGQDNP